MKLKELTKLVGEYQRARKKCAKDIKEIEDAKARRKLLATLDTFDKLQSNCEARLKELKAYQRGWIKGRDECWKAADNVGCARESYQKRIAELETRYFLVEGGEPVFYLCDDRSEIVATFVPTDPTTVRLERGAFTRFN